MRWQGIAGSDALEMLSVGKRMIGCLFAEVCWTWLVEMRGQGQED